MSDDKYKNRSELVQFNIVEVKRATKRKAATIKLHVSDELAEGLIKHQFSSRMNPHIARLMLTWFELKEEQP